MLTNRRRIKQLGSDIQELPTVNSDMPSLIFMESNQSTAYGSNPNNRALTYYQTAKKTEYGFDKSTYRELVKLIKNLIQDEAIIAQFLQMQLNLTSLGMENTFKGDVDDRYKVAFNSFAGRVNENIVGKTKGLDEFQRNFLIEYWTSGMVVTIERVANMKMSMQGARNITYKVPVELDILNPLRINLDNIYKTQEIYYDLDETTTADIKTNGVKADFLTIYPDKVSKVRPTPDNPNPYQPKSKSDIVKMVLEQGADSIPLPMDKTRWYFRKYESYSLYPLPFLASALTALADKAMLRESDRSVMAKLISMLLVYKVGSYNNTGNKTNVGDNIIKAAADSFSRNMASSGDGRMMITFVPETHSLEWVTPDSGNLMNPDKYRAANLEIYTALYGPAAPQLLSSAGSVDNELFLKVIRGLSESFIAVYKRFIEEIYQDIIDWNKMRFSASSVNFKPKRLSLWDTKEFIAMRANLADKNQLSLRTILDDAGEDIDAEVPNLIQERDWREQEGIFIALTTFNQTATDSSGNTKTTSSQQSKGRPTGVTETKPRATQDITKTTNN